MSSEIEAFCENAERFCIWAEGKKHDLMEARQILLGLMLGIPHVESYRGTTETDQEFERREHAGWKEDVARLSDLPFRHYRVVFDPHDFEEKEPVMSDLSDDLADIYGDLFHGMAAYRKGFKKEAIGLWADSYFYHWGQHAASAVAAIDSYYRNNQGSE